MILVWKEKLLWEGIKGRALVLKGRLIIQTLSKGNSRLGELLLVNFMFKDKSCDI